MTGPHILPYYVCCDEDPGEEFKQPMKMEGLLVLFSLILQLFVNIKIIVLKHKTKICEKILKSNQCTTTNPETMNEIMSIEKQTIINCTAIFWGFLFILMFSGLNQRIRDLTVEELNEFPNYLYLYCLQLLSFQLLGFFLLITMFAKDNKMFKTVMDTLRG